MHRRVRIAHRRMEAQQGVGGLEGAEGTGVRHAGRHEGTRGRRSSKRSECKHKGAETASRRKSKAQGVQAACGRKSKAECEAREEREAWRQAWAGGPSQETSSIAVQCFLKEGGLIQGDLGHGHT